jgi:16S rRNA (cytosine967-C5)-methyltransferase
MALEEGLPPVLAAGLVRAFGAEAAAEAAALNSAAPLVVRANTLRASREELSERLAREGVVARPTALSPLGLVLETRRPVYGLPAFREGWLEVQDEGSQLLGLLVDAPARPVVDLCAGAGGKTLQLAAQMRNRGELHAFDPSEPALAKLRRRARRAGVHCVRAARLPREDAEACAALAPLRGRAWRVLVDAPCSGSGALRRNPDARRRLDEARLAEHVRLQGALLARAAPLVRPGGRLVYGTCSVLVEEGEDVVDAFLAGHPAFALRSAGDVLGPALAPLVTSGAFLRVSPRRHGTDGFFGAVLERRAG